MVYGWAGSKRHSIFSGGWNHDHGVIGRVYYSLCSNLSKENDEPETTIADHGVRTSEEFIDGNN